MISWLISIGLAILFIALIIFIGIFFDALCKGEDWAWIIFFRLFIIGVITVFATTIHDILF